MSKRVDEDAYIKFNLVTPHFITLFLLITCSFPVIGCLNTLRKTMVDKKSNNMFI